MPPTCQSTSNARRVGPNGSRLAGARTAGRSTSCATPMRRDEQDDARRVEEPADHGELDARRQQPAPADDQRRMADHVVPAPVEHGLGEDHRGQRADLAVREVDDPGRPVDQHDADAEHPVHQAEHDAVEEHLVGRGPRREVEVVRGRSTCTRLIRLRLPRNTARTRSSRSSSSCGRALEADLALLHEHGPVGERERDVDRLLDDHHRRALRLAALDDRRAAAATTSGASPSESSSMSSSSRLEQERHGQREHLLLAARERGRRAVGHRPQRGERVERAVDPRSRTARRCAPSEAADAQVLVHGQRGERSPCRRASARCRGRPG